MEALKDVQTGLEIAERDDDLFSEAWIAFGEIGTVLNRPVAIYSTGKPLLDAPSCFKKGVAVAKEQNSLRLEATALWKWAIYEKQQGNYQQATHLAEEAIAHFETLKLPLFVQKVKASLEEKRPFPQELSERNGVNGHLASSH